MNIILEMVKEKFKDSGCLVTSRNLSIYGFDISRIRIAGCQTSIWYTTPPNEFDVLLVHGCHTGVANEILDYIKEISLLFI